MRLLLAAAEIPGDGATVTKRTGEVQYTLRNAVRIFGEDGGPREIKAQDGARFLVSSKGDLTVIPGTTELLWCVDDEDLLRWLDLHVNGEEK
jgi:hypothetical protein